MRLARPVALPGVCVTGSGKDSKVAVMMSPSSDEYEIELTSDIAGAGAARVRVPAARSMMKLARLPMSRRIVLPTTPSVLHCSMKSSSAALSPCTKRPPLAEPRTSAYSLSSRPLR